MCGSQRASDIFSFISWTALARFQSINTNSNKLVVDTISIHNKVPTKYTLHNICTGETRVCKRCGSGGKMPEEVSGREGPYVHVASILYYIIYKRCKCATKLYRVLKEPHNYTKFGDADNRVCRSRLPPREAGRVQGEPPQSSWCLRRCTTAGTDRRRLGVQAGAGSATPVFFVEPPCSDLGHWCQRCRHMCNATTLRQELLDEEGHQIMSRRNVSNFEPSVWGDFFLTYSSPLASSTEQVRF